MYSTANLPCNITPGTEITDKSNLKLILINGIVIVYSNGQDYKGKNSLNLLSKLNKDIMISLGNPPRFPYPGIITTKSDSSNYNAFTVNGGNHSNDNPNDNNPNDNIPKTNKHLVKEIVSEFPVFEDSIELLNGIKKIINKHDKLHFHDFGEFIIFDYGLNMEFPTVNPNIKLDKCSVPARPARH